MKFKTFRFIPKLFLALLFSSGFVWADDGFIYGNFSGDFIFGGSSNLVALFEGNFRFDDERFQFDGETYEGEFPDGTPCLSPINVCSVWITDEGRLYNQTESFVPAPDGSFTQVLTFVGGTDEFEDASGTAFVKGSLDAAGGFKGKFKGVLFEEEDDDNDDD